MKKIIITTLLILFALPLVFGLNTIVGKGPSLQTTLLRYEPVPAEPGDVLDVYVLVTNTGGSPARNVKVEAVDNFPFSNDNPQDAIKSIPTLPGQESYLVRYKIRIVNDAPEGTANFKVRVTSTDATGGQDTLLSIPIKTNNPTVAIDKITMTPETVQPGGTATITLFLHNLAGARLKDVSVSLSTVKSLGTTITQLPYAPIGGSLDRRLPELKPNEDVQVSYTIITEPGAISDLYRIPLTITFSDESGTTHTIEDQVGLIIKAEPTLDIYLETVNVYTDKLQGDITIKYVNNGLAKVKLLTTQIQPNDGFTVNSQSNEVYVGNIDSDDYETVTYTITAKKNALEIPIKATYLDSFNNPQETIVTLQTNLVSQKASGNGKSGTSTILLVIIVVLILAFVAYRIIKRKKKR